MDNFIIKKKTEEKIYKTIRFPKTLNNQINNIIENANKGKKRKEYSFNSFVISACQYALESINNN